MFARSPAWKTVIADCHTRTAPKGFGGPRGPSPIDWRIDSTEVIDAKWNAAGKHLIESAYYFNTFLL